MPDIAAGPHRLFTKPVVQIAYAVADVRSAALQWAARVGAGPFFVLDHIDLAEVWHLGQPATFDHSSAYGQWGSVMVELVQQHHVAPESLAAAVRARDYGIHHLAWFADSLPEEQKRLNDAGFPEVMTAETRRGLRFSFLDGGTELGHLIELYEATPPILAFYGQVAEAAQSWDQRDPIRTM